MSTKLNRRNFIKISGPLVIGSTLAEMISKSLASSAPAYEDKLTAPGKLEESFVNSICGECGSGCGVTLRLVDGIPVNVRGNEIHPLNRGGLCLKGAASLQLLYNPDRLQQSRERACDRGLGLWNTLSYQQALNRIAGVLGPILDSGNSDKVWVIAGERDRTLLRLLEHIRNKSNLKNIYRFAITDSEQAVYAKINGWPNQIAYDFLHAKYILSFGARLLEEDKKMSWFTKTYGELRELSPLGRTKIVQIDPQLTPTGIKADEWLPVKPDSYGDIALCIAHLLFAQDTYDKASAEKYISNLAELKEKLSSDYFSPTKTAERSGLEAQALVRLALEIATHTPAVAVPGERILWHENGSWQFEAVHLLNVLTGALGSPGGVLVLTEIPGLEAGPAIPTMNPDHLAEALERQAAPELLIIIDANPFYLASQPEILLQALNNTKLVVALDSFPSEATEFADIVIPLSTPYERWQLSDSTGGFPGQFVSVVKPAIEPLFETHESVEVMLDLFAQTLKLGWKNSEAFIRSLAEPLYNSRMGQIFSESLDADWIKSLQERGWSFAGYNNFDDFWSAMVDKGGWWNPEFVEKKKIAGKFKFSNLDELIAGPANLPGGQKNDNELWLNLYALPSLGVDGHGAYAPMLLEISASHIKNKWGSWVEINPETARRLGIKDREYVKLQSGDTSLIVQARLYVGTHPEVVSLAMGLGHTHFGRFAKGIGVNPLKLVKRSATNLPALLDMKVLVNKIDNGDTYHA